MTSRCFGVEQVRVARLGDRRLEPRLERGLDVVGLVDEVQDVHVVLRLQRVDPVEPGERLHGGDAGQRLVHVHGAQQRLVEPGLVLVGDDQEPVLVLVPRGRLQDRRASRTRTCPAAALRRSR